LHTRPRAAVLGHSGSIYKASLKTQPERFIEGMEPSGLDPFRGYIARSPTDAFTQLGDLSCPSLAANVHRHCNLVQSQFHRAKQTVKFGPELRRPIGGLPILRFTSPATLMSAMVCAVSPSSR
jgi:hypothetical protein